MKKISLVEQKKIQLDILKYTYELCEKNDLTCFLGGGTLLGAVRHKGYIPWDDDIDIMMPRKDYEVLISIFNREENKYFKLLTFNNTDDYYYPFAKIVDVRTKLEENNFKEIKDMGIYVDLFPIDYLPENNKKIIKIFKKYKVLQKMNSMYVVKDIKKTTNNKLKLIFKQLLLPILKKDLVKKSILKAMDDIGKKYNNTKKVACISGRYLEKEIMDSDYISDFLFLEFEGEKYKVPKGYDDYLKKHYGDYMKLPPKRMQFSNHNNIAYWR